MNIMLLEDNTSDADLTKRGLLTYIPGCTIEVAQTLTQARQLLKKSTAYDIALLDMKLPDGNGLDLLMEIRQSEINTAVVMITGLGNEEVAVAALKAGADDYIVKRSGYISQLPQVIDYAIKGFKQNLQLKSDIIDVLFVEHNSSDIDLIIHHLSQYAPYIHIDAVLKMQDALSRLVKGEPISYKVILIDYRLPGLDALEAIKIIRQERKLNIPIILITDQGNEEVAVQALKLGANEYLTKNENYLYRLPSLITSAYQHWELKRKQAALAESEAKYRLLADNSGDVIFVLNMSYNHTYISPAVKSLRGYDPNEAIKQNIFEVLTPYSYEKALKVISEILSMHAEKSKNPVLQKTIELEMIKKDQSTVWTEVKFSLITDENDNPVRILGVTRDISKRKAVTDELRKLSHAVEQSPASIVITDLSGAIEYVNPRFTELTGYTLAEVKGQNTRLLKSGYTSGEEFEILWQTIISGSEWRGEFHNKRKDGSLFWEQASISSIKNSDGKITHFLAVKEDITEKKNYQEELVKAKEKAEESDKLKAAFLSNISHEIRTPINAIVGFSGFLNEPDLPQEKQKHFTDIIVQSSNQLLSIICDIVNIATIETGQEEVREKEINLNAIFNLLYEQFILRAQNQKIALHFKISLSDDDANIITDQTKLVQVLTNLIGNALKFTIQGYVNFGYTVKDNELEFFVEDTGIGIPSNMFGEIFKRFRQLENGKIHNFGGSGLGLSISKAYIELLGGKMWLTSELDKGSTFYFTIPYKKAPQKTLQNESNDKFEIKRAKTLLVAEDEESNFQMLEALLSGLDVNIIRVRNGLEAVEICKSKQTIDLVLMDIKMPVMDGYEATRLIKSFMPHLPIIAQTAYASDADKNNALACGCSDFISKPLQKELLLSKII